MSVGINTVVTYQSNLDFLQFLGPCSFRRRELATSIATRTRFPELVVQEEKRVRFVVVNGLSIIEKPSSINIDDAEWYDSLFFFF